MQTRLLPTTSWRVPVDYYSSNWRRHRGVWFNLLCTACKPGSTMVMNFAFCFMGTSCWHFCSSVISHWHFSLMYLESTRLSTSYFHEIENQELRFINAQCCVLTAVLPHPWKVQSRGLNHFMLAKPHRDCFLCCESVSDPHSTPREKHGRSGIQGQLREKRGP